MENEKAIFIYGLVDPRDNSIRYVGKTINPKKRYGEHLRDTSNTKKVSWIKKLIKLGLKPNIIFLQIFFNEDLWKELEIKWVSACRKKCNEFTNLTDGGDGHSMSPESIQKAVEKRKNKFLDPEYKKWFLDICCSPEHKKKISDAKRGTQLSDECRKSMSIRRKGKKSPMRGKSIYEFWIKKYGEEEANKLISEYHKNVTKNKSGVDNPMAGKSVYDAWVEKYGKETADIKYKKLNIIMKETAKKRNRGAHGYFIKNEV